MKADRRKFNKSRNCTADDTKQGSFWLRYDTPARNKEQATSRLFARIDKGVSILRIISKLKKVVSFLISKRKTKKLCIDLELISESMHYA